MRAARELFERAQADRCSMAEAKRRLRAERWAAADARLAAKRCGTIAPAAANDAVDANDDPPRAEQWWQR